MTTQITNNTDTLHTALTAPLSYAIVAESLGQKDKNRETVFTLENPARGTHITFRVRRPKGFKTMLLDVMTGSDNEGSYEYVGSMTRGLWVKPNTSKASDNAKGKLNGVMWYMSELRNARSGKASSFGAVVLNHSGSCTCCGRTLTNPESLETGIGPVCQGRLNNGSKTARNAKDLK